MHDLGRALGCGAHLQGLTRTQIGPFRLEEAVTPEELERSVQGGWWEAFLEPLDAPVQLLPAAILDVEATRVVQNGRLYPWEPSANARALQQGELCRAYSDDGRLIALVGYDGEASSWRPHKVFAR